jgi:hypothetical protein
MEIKKTKIKIIGILLIIVLTAIVGFFALNKDAFAQNNSLKLNALIFDEQGQLVPNGEYTIRFSLYTIDRVKTDPYPSNKDEGERVWQTTKTLSIEDGKLKTTLEIGDLEYNKYYLGIRVNHDAEMIPRKPLVLGKDKYIQSKTDNENEKDKIISEINTQSNTNNKLVQ